MSVSYLDKIVTFTPTFENAGTPPKHGSRVEKDSFKLSRSLSADGRWAGQFRFISLLFQSVLAV